MVVGIASAQRGERGFVVAVLDAHVDSAVGSGRDGDLNPLRVDRDNGCPVELDLAEPNARATGEAVAADQRNAAARERAVRGIYAEHRMRQGIRQLDTCVGRAAIELEAAAAGPVRAIRLTDEGRIRPRNAAWRKRGAY